MNIKLFRILSIVSASIAGGIVGYVIADFLVYKITEKEFEQLEGEIVSVEETDEHLEIKMLPKKDYNKISKSLIDKESIDTIIKKYNPGFDSTKPRKLKIVTHEEVLTQKMGYKVETYTFYNDDKVWTDEDQLIVSIEDVLVDERYPNPEELFIFANKADDPDVVYLIDEFNEKYYELIRLKGSYDNLVLGMPVETKKPRSKRKTIIEEENDDGE